MKIDIVYTWVNGRDPAWRARRDAVMRQFGRPIEESVTDGRFEDNEELRYSLRSLQRHAPWANRIHMVTDRQTPAWLDVNQDRVRVVDHTEIFSDPAELPTFSSRPIERNLHRIPGLSEHFVYFNDDFFLCRDAQPEDFFADGRPRIFTGSQLSGRQKDLMRVRNAADNTHRYAIINSRTAVKQQTGVTVKFNVRHFPQPCTRSLWEEVSDVYRAELALTGSHRFRDASDVLPTYVFAMHAIASGQGVQTRVNMQGARPSLKSLLLGWLGGPDGMYVDLSDARCAERLARLRSIDPLFFCLNQGRDTAPAALQQMADLLRFKFPQASAFERVADDAPV